MARSPLSGPDPAPVGEPGSWADIITRERPRLVGLAYRITGSRLDAEDIVQEAWVRTQQTDLAGIDEPVAWLTTVVSRLALDDLRAACHRREVYVGEWLPEPVRTGLGGTRATPADPADQAALAESLTFGFLRVLETLSPPERVVFLLADVFDTPYRDIATVVDRSEETCRKMASRARRRVRARPALHDPPDEAIQVAYQLLVAITGGEVDRVVELLADDVVLVSDGGATTRAARRPVLGAARVARFMVNLNHRFPEARGDPVMINGEPGVISSVDGERLLALAAQVVDGRVQALHVIRNPEKLAALDVQTEMV